MADETKLTIEPSSAARQGEWIALRAALYPHTSIIKHEKETTDILQDDAHKCCFLALDSEGHAIGMIEATVRFEYINGTATSPVGFIESLFVSPDDRQRGIAGRLAATAENWAKERGCREMASDALLENMDSHVFHRKIGFRETERIVCFSKPLV